MSFGIDTASVAGNKIIDWAAAKAAGLSFACLRSNYGDETDSAFAREWPRLGESGLVRGAYLFLRYPRGGKSAPLPEAQAHAMVRTLGSVAPCDLPPSLDLEFPGAGRAETGMTVAQCMDWALRARGVLKDELGVDPILYTSARVWRDDLDNSSSTDFVDCPLWLARYFFPDGKAVQPEVIPPPPVPLPWSGPWGGDNWWIHQYQGNAIGFPGFDGKVDMNRFNPLTQDGSRAKWVQRRIGVALTGKLDEATTKAIVDFQAARGLVADGIVGLRTFAYLAWQRV